MSSTSLRIRKVRHKEMTSKFFAVIEGMTIDARPTRIIMRVSDALKHDRLSQALNDHGVVVGPDTGVRQIATTQIPAAPFDEGTLITCLTGWHERQYVRPDGKVLGEGKTLIFVPVDQLQRDAAFGIATGLPQEEFAAGSLADWIDGIGKPAAASSVLAFALAVSFAALLLKPARGESGLFHLTSNESSKGKTTSLLAALSVHRRAVHGSVPTWDFTEKHMEESAALFCDSLLPLDEIALIGSSASDAASRAMKTAFVLTAGVGKGRSERYSQMGSSTWRILALSTGETSIGSTAYAAHRARLAGDLVRAIDCPLTLHPEHGIFDRMNPGQAAGRLVNAIHRTAGKHYGVPAIAFVDGLIADWDSSLERVAHWKRKFERVLGVSTDGWELRFASRFALAYAAARLALVFELLPWSKEFALEVIEKAYRSARSAVETKAELHTRGLDRIFEFVAESDRFAWIDDVARDGSQEALSTVDGLLIPYGGDLVYAIKPDRLSGWLGSSMPLGQIEPLLVEGGYVVVNHKGGARRQAFIADGLPRPRLLWLKQSRFLSSNCAADLARIRT